MNVISKVAFCNTQHKILFAIGNSIKQCEGGMRTIVFAQSTILYRLFPPYAG